MPIIHYENLEQLGVIKDVEPHELPQNAWSDGQNVRFEDGAVEKFTGHEEVYITATAAPYFAMQINTASTRFWHYAGLTDIYATDGVNDNPITPAGSTGTLNATADINWTGGALGGGVYILNNGVDEPFQWAGTGVTDVYEALANWPAGMVARVIRPFKQFLVAADIDEGSGRNGTLLRWSHPATPGSVPSSWDYTDRTKDAGRVQISQTPDYIIEMAPMRDLMMIYKENNIWSMQYIGGNAKFSFRKVFGEIGILSRRCAQSFRGQHVVLTADDLILHNGNEASSIIDGRWRNWLVNNIDGTNFARSFVTINHRDSEVWACIPQSGYSFPNVALVWNWQSNTVTARELPLGTSHIAWGIIDTGGDLTFDGDVGTFDASEGTFDEQVDSGALREMLMLDTTRNLFYRANSTEQFNGSPMTAYVERKALPLGRQDIRTGAIRPDVSKQKYITELWPVIEGRDHIGDTVSWSGPYNYTIGTTRKINTRVVGPVIDIKFQSNTNITWKLISFGVNVRLGSYR